MHNSQINLSSAITTFSLVILTLLVQPIFADETAQIRSLIEQLDSPKFAQRNSASASLRILGQTAIAALGEAARDGNREVSGRSFDLLATHLNSADTAVKQSARTMLEDLSRGDNSPTALKARKILEPPKPEPNRSIQLGMLQNGIRAAIVPGQQHIQIQVGGATKKIDITQNNKHTIIEQKADGTLDVTEGPVGGAAKKSTYKNVEDLKKKNAEAHRLFQSFGRGMIKIQGGKAGLPKPKPAAQGRADAIDRMLDSLQKSIDRLKQQQKNAATPDQLQKSIDTLEKQKLSIQQLRQRAEK